MLRPQHQNWEVQWTKPEQLASMKFAFTFTTNFGGTIDAQALAFKL